MEYNQIRWHVNIRAFGTVAKQKTYICISALNPDRIDWGKRKAGLTVAPVATIKVPYR